MTAAPTGAGARPSWTTGADVRARLRRRWSDGSLLRAYAAGEAFPVFDVPLRGPRVAEIGADLAAVRAWVAGLEAQAQNGRCFTLEFRAVGGRLIGRNQLPSRASVTTYEQAWALLGVGADVRDFDVVLTRVEAEPPARIWAAAYPLRALELHREWPTLLSAYRWLNDHRGSGHYLREIHAPGVDTKFVERHRSVLAALLNVDAAPSGFLDGLGLAARPELLRLRPHAAVGGFGGLTDVTASVVELRAMALDVRAAFIVENEVTFLSVPVPDRGIVLWGKGFEVDRAGSLPWLKDVDVSYWGDLDSHGFAILDRLRTWLPQTRSLLMDRSTLLAHRDRWGTEATPTRADLRRLGTDEKELYADLVRDRYAERIRLEQERIDWAWALERIVQAEDPPSVAR